jgi:hypothetical protein
MYMYVYVFALNIYVYVFIHYIRTWTYISTYINELNTPAALELVTVCHLGPQTCKLEIQHLKLVKLCHLGPYPFVGHTYLQKDP